MKSAVSPIKYSTSSYFLYSVRALQLCMLLALSGCSTVNPYYNPLKPHHTPEGFKNNYTRVVDKSFGDLLRWQADRIKNKLPPPAQTPTPQARADLAFIHANAMARDRMQPAVTWLGHATTLVQASGLNVLTDPVLSERASPVQFAGPQRAQPPGLALAQLPHIDVVLISHNHFDHLDENTVRALAKQAQGAPLFIVPLGIKAWLTGLGISKVHELDWWDTHTVDGVEFVFTPVQHWSTRGVGDRNQSLWGGWAVLGPDFHWYFSGDTGYSPDFTDTQKHFAARHTAEQGGGFDLALLAVGAYEPRWFMKEQHINPAEAVQIHQDLRAKRSMGVHWGTFALTDEPLDQPPKDLAIARTAAGVPEDAFFLLAVGETRLLPARTAR
jgi:N-acyl-phosphatidylethanolamine-hydrolysing phospholipase D